MNAAIAINRTANPRIKSIETIIHFRFTRSTTTPENGKTINCGIKDEAINVAIKAVEPVTDKTQNPIAIW